MVPRRYHDNKILGMSNPGNQFTVHISIRQPNTPRKMEVIEEKHRNFSNAHAIVTK